MSFPEIPGWKGECETGREAAIAYAPKAGTRRAAVLAALEELKAASAEEISEATGIHWYLVRPRLSELKAFGLVRDSGGRGIGALGGKVAVWRPATPEERAAYVAAKEDDHA